MQDRHTTGITIKPVLQPALRSGGDQPAKTHLRLPGGVGPKRHGFQ